MRYDRKTGPEFAKGDMTPMIDMTFQLIAFFMVLINFTEADQNKDIKLPASELAKPPEGPAESPITLQLTEKGKVIFGPEEALSLDALRPMLLQEREVIRATPGRTVARATIIIRADLNTKTGEVQELIQLCQELGFQNVRLRAKQEERERT